jgi:hypothetical protein
VIHPFSPGRARAFQSAWRRDCQPKHGRDPRDGRIIGIFCLYSKWRGWKDGSLRIELENRDAVSQIQEHYRRYFAPYWVMHRCLETMGGYNPRSKLTPPEVASLQVTWVVSHLAPDDSVEEKEVQAALPPVITDIIRAYRAWTPSRHGPIGRSGPSRCSRHGPVGRSSSSLCPFDESRPVRCELAPVPPLSCTPKHFLRSPFPRLRAFSTPANSTHVYPWLATCPKGWRSANRGSLPGREEPETRCLD